VRVLGVDLGERRIGLALGDTTTRVATPLTVVTRRGDRTVEHGAIGDVAQEWEVALLVVGLPLSLDGHRGRAALAAEEEAGALGGATGLEVAFYDERFTTVSAERSLRQGGLGGRKRRKVIDAVAAAVLLQGWLDAHPGPPPEHP
jgi:putative Holliday junction resolvase